MFLQLGPSNCGLLQKKKTPTMCLCLYSHLHATLGSALSSLFVCPLLLLCDLNHSTSQHPSFLTCPHTQQRVQLPLCTPSVFCSVTSTIQPLSTPVPSLAPHSAAHSAPSLCALSVLLCDLYRSISQHPSFLTCTTRSSAFSSLFVRPQCFAL